MTIILTTDYEMGEEVRLRHNGAGGIVIGFEIKGIDECGQVNYYHVTVLDAAGQVYELPPIALEKVGQEED